MPAEVGREPGRRLGVRRRDLRRRERRGAVEVDRGPVALAGEQRPVVGARRPARHLGEGARAPPRLGVPAVADRRVGARHRGAGDAERLGQLALAGQPGAGRDPAVADQQHQRVGEAGVGRTAVEPADQGGHPPGGDGAVHAGHCRTIGYLSKGHLPRRMELVTTTALPHRAPRVLTDLGPIAQLRAGRLGRRLPQLYVGLVLYGFSIALMVRGHLGNAPWDVLHSGLARHLPITLGEALVIVSFLVMVLWIPLREVPGIGTISNAIVIGVSADAFLAVLDQPGAMWLRGVLMVGGVAVCGLATAMYIGAQLGRGPRDGLMTGLARRTGLSLRLVRTLLEITVVVIGLLLGGVAGVGTVLYALAIGPLTQLMLPAWIVDVRRRRADAQSPTRAMRTVDGRAELRSAERRQRFSAWWR